MFGYFTMLTAFQDFFKVQVLFLSLKSIFTRNYWKAVLYKKKMAERSPDKLSSARLPSSNDIPYQRLIEEGYSSQEKAEMRMRKAKEEQDEAERKAQKREAAEKKKKEEEDLEREFLLWAPRKQPNKKTRIKKERRKKQVVISNFFIVMCHLSIVWPAIKVLNYFNRLISKGRDIKIGGGKNRDAFFQEMSGDAFFQVMELGWAYQQRNLWHW